MTFGKTPFGEMTFGEVAFGDLTFGEPTGHPLVYMIQNVKIKDYINT